MLEELGQLAKVSARPSGIVVANGTAKLDSSNNYHVTGNVEARDLAFSQGAQRIRNVNLFTAVNFDSQRLDLKGLRLSALGGRFDGDVSLEEFARYNLNGNLRNLDVRTAAVALGQRPLPYDGVVSGPVQARGDLKAAKSKLSTASAKLSIAPGTRGIPLSGRINAEYNGATDNINVADSYIALPNTRLNLSGSLNNQLNLELNSKNLNDIFAAISPGSKPAVTLNGGQARFTGVVTGGLNAPQISGHLALSRFAVEGRQFDSLGADMAAAKNRASVSNGLLQRGAMQASFDGTAGLQNWSPKPNQPLKGNSKRPQRRSCGRDGAGRPAAWRILGNSEHERECERHDWKSHGNSRSPSSKWHTEGRAFRSSSSSSEHVRSVDRGPNCIVDCRTCRNQYDSGVPAPTRQYDERTTARACAEQPSESGPDPHSAERETEYVGIGEPECRRYRKCWRRQRRTGMTRRSSC